MGSYLPAFSHAKVFLGHEFNTNDFWKKWALADSFYRGTMSRNELEILFKSNKIEYVFWDRDKPEKSYQEFMEPVFTASGGKAVLYKVIY